MYLVPFPSHQNLRRIFYTIPIVKSMYDDACMCGCVYDSYSECGAPCIILTITIYSPSYDYSHM